MTTPKLSIEQALEAHFNEGKATPPARAKKSPVAPSRRARLPMGISYHPTPQGMKYRIRIRSKKKLQTLGTDKAIDEIFDDLQQAEQRLLKLKYKKEDIQKEFIKQIADEIKTITLSALFEEHYRRYYSIQKSAKEHKSRMNVISNTLIPVDDPRVSMFAHLRHTQIKPDSKQIPFGLIPVVDYKVYLQSFIDKRKEKVKNQTVVNDLMFIHTALKNANVYFKNIPKIAHPLEDVDFKTLPDQVVYKDKRITPETRIAVETLLIEKSRLSHYRDMFVFLYETGVRISEALTITKKDCNIEKGTIFLISKKNEKPRYLGITQKLKEVIENRTNGKKLTDKLFPYKKETYQTKLKAIRPYLKEMGIDFSWHMLRHTFITNGFENKSISTLMNEVDINNFQHFKEKYINPIEAEKIAIKVAKAQALTPTEMQTVVGHSDLQVTIGTYTHTRELSKEEQLIKQNEELKSMLLAMAKQLEEKK